MKRNSMKILAYGMAMLMLVLPLAGAVFPALAASDDTTSAPSLGPSLNQSPQSLPSKAPPSKLLSLEITAPFDPADLAEAMGIDALHIISASLNGSDANSVGIGTTPLGNFFPTDGNTFAILSTGLAESADDPNNEGSLSFALDGLNNSQGEDLTQFALTLQVPASANCATFDFIFYSEELAEFVSSQFNDAFTAEFGGTNLTIVNDQVVAPLNFAFDTAGNVISVNTVFGITLGTATTYDGGTSLLRARAPVTPDSMVDIVFSVQDLGDSVYDSAVFLDNFVYSNESACDNGAYEDEGNQPPTDITLSNSNINENQPVGALIGTLSTTDPDAGDTFAYSLCGGADDASFQISGDNLQSAEVFDFETTSSYSICIRSTDADSLSITKTFGININNLVDTPTFTDVPMSYWARSWIEQLYDSGITGGCATNPLQYCPEDPVTRAQMAVFLEKGMHGSSFIPPDVPPSFGDTTGHWAKDWIEALANDSITVGCGAENYCPDYSTTRAQMAVFLLKAEHGASYSPPAVGGSTGFNDVSPSYWAAPWIKQLAAEGITGGCAPNLYCPEEAITRAQMAVFLVRTFNLP